MPGANVITVGGLSLDIATTVKDSKRLYVRRQEAAQESDPTRPMVARWNVSGPIGQSYERADGYLGHDHGTLETRQDGLLTSLGAVTSLTISGSDPLATGSAALGAMPLGLRALGGGSSQSAPTAITHIAEYGKRLFLGRGAFVTQVNPSSWTVEQTKAVSAVVRGMAEWFGKLRIGLGQFKAIQTVTSPTSSGAMYADTQVSGSDTNGREMRVINDRLWWNRAADSADDNKLRFTEDDFASQSSGFRVGDRGVPATAIGVVDGTPVLGSEVGPAGFTDDGASFVIGSALQQARSAENGRQFAAGPDGWTYMISALCLYAIKGAKMNPVGIGSDSMSGFDGFDGRPVAVFAWRDVVFVAYENSAGDTWRILQGQYNPSLDGGELDWYPFATRTASIRCIGATSVPTLPTIVWGEGTTVLARSSKGRGNRDMSDASYTYSVAGGQWFGSRMMRNQTCRKTVRWGRFLTEDCDASNTWTLAVSFDGGSYTNIGSAVTTNGGQKVAPSDPTTAPTGFTPKPRLTQVAASSTTPPKIRGLEIGYDERPDSVTKVDCTVKVSRADLVTLRGYRDGGSSTGRNAVIAILPDEVGTTYYAFVNRVDEEDGPGDEIRATLALSMVETS